VNKIRMLFTTGEIAGLVGSNSKTVARWIDDGALAGVRFPGIFKERRVHRDVLRAFCEAHQFTWAIEALDREEEGDELPRKKPGPVPKPGPVRGAGPTRKK
jgi:excisionase family DNA binding protein